MISIFVFSLIAYGICNILIWGSLFSGWRSFLYGFGGGDYSIYKLFTCFMCLGFWVGVVLSGVGIYYGIAQLLVITTPNLYLTLLLNGAFSSAVCWLINTIQEWFEPEDNGNGPQIL